MLTFVFKTRDSSRAADLWTHQIFKNQIFINYLNNYGDYPMSAIF